MRSTTDPPSKFDDAWILRHRPAKNTVDPRRPYAFLAEKEYIAVGSVEDVAVVFITNRECPLRCLMCDLWKNTTDDSVPPGAVPEQIRWALDQLPPCRHIKLYNSGNFFDPNAISESDYAEIAELVSGFDTVTVETHPRMIGRRCFSFQRMLRPQLHVAMGLETVHTQVLRLLNKRMTSDEFRTAAVTLTGRGIAVRAFIMLRPPTLSESEGVFWAKRSLDFAFDAGVECCAIIPTRAGNGAMDELATAGLFAPPTLESLEATMDYGLSLKRGRVFVDLWDVENISAEAPNAADRIARLARMNLTQQIEPPVRGVADVRTTN